VTRPSDGSISPAAMRRSVDLPHPERPTSVTSSFSPTSRSIPSSARTSLPPRPPKRFATPSMRMSGSASVPRYFFFAGLKVAVFTNPPA
jgi:hypothetical protein